MFYQNGKESSCTNFNLFSKRVANKSTFCSPQLFTCNPSDVCTSTMLVTPSQTSATSELTLNTLDIGEIKIKDLMPLIQKLHQESNSYINNQTLSSKLKTLDSSNKIMKPVKGVDSVAQEGSQEFTVTTLKDASTITLDKRDNPNRISRHQKVSTTFLIGTTDISVSTQSFNKKVLSSRKSKDNSVQSSNTNNISTQFSPMTKPKKHLKKSSDVRVSNVLNITKSWCPHKTCPTQTESWKSSRLSPDKNKTNRKSSTFLVNNSIVKTRKNCKSSGTNSDNFMEREALKVNSSKVLPPRQQRAEKCSSIQCNEVYAKGSPLSQQYLKIDGDLNVSSSFLQRSGKRFLKSIQRKFKNKGTPSQSTSKIFNGKHEYFINDYINEGHLSYESASRIKIGSTKSDGGDLVRAKIDMRYYNLCQDETLETMESDGNENCKWGIKRIDEKFNTSKSSLQSLILNSIDNKFVSKSKRQRSSKSSFGTKPRTYSSRRRHVLDRFSISSEAKIRPKIKGGAPGTTSHYARLNFPKAEDANLINKCMDVPNIRTSISDRYINEEDSSSDHECSCDHCLGLGSDIPDLKKLELNSNKSSVSQFALRIDLESEREISKLEQSNTA